MEFYTVIHGAFWKIIVILSGSAIAACTTCLFEINERGERSLIGNDKSLFLIWGFIFHILKKAERVTRWCVERWNTNRRQGSMPCCGRIRYHRQQSKEGLSRYDNYKCDGHLIGAECWEVGPETSGTPGGSGSPCVYFCRCIINAVPLNVLRRSIRCHNNRTATYMNVGHFSSDISPLVYSRTFPRHFSCPEILDCVKWDI